jgi:hypothetical protein
MLCSFSWTARAAGIGVVAAAVALSGCSGSSSAGKQAGGPSGSPTPSATATTLSLDKAKALAAAAVLTSADLPGYTSKPQTHDASDDATEKQVEACLGLTVPHYVTRNIGTSFSKGTDEIDSSADVVESAAVAQQQLQGLLSSKAPTCFVRTLKSALASSGITVVSGSAKRVPMTVAGSDGAFGFRLAVVAKAQGRTINITGYETGSLVGQVEIDVTLISVGPSSVTLGDLTALTTKATARVRAAS